MASSAYVSLKDECLVASLDIKAGQQLFVDALVLASMKVPASSDTSKLVVDLTKRYLDQSASDAMWSRISYRTGSLQELKSEHSGTSDEEWSAAYAKVSAHSFRVDREGQMWLVMRLLSSFLNHSCDPNAALHLLSDGRGLVVTLKDIPIGEKVTVSYTSKIFTLPTRRRREKLQKLYGFECTCQKCTAPEENSPLLESKPVTDAKREQLEKRFIDCKGSRHFRSPQAGMNFIRKAEEFIKSWPLGAFHWRFIKVRRWLARAYLMVWSNTPAKYDKQLQSILTAVLEDERKFFPMYHNDRMARLATWKNLFVTFPNAATAAEFERLVELYAEQDGTISISNTSDVNIHA